MKEQDKTLNELSKLLDGLQKELIAIRNSLQREPREMALYYNEYAKQWRQVANGEDMVIAGEDGVEVMHVREIL